MLVPRTRLILWTALIVLPFAAVGGTLPGAAMVSVLCIGAFVAVAVFDALAAGRSLAGVRVELPEFVRLQKNRESAMEVRLHNPAQAARWVRLGFAFPQEIAADDEQTTHLPADAELARVEWLLRPRERGLYFLERAFLEGVSPFGFWALRTSHAVRCELRVYPNLFAEQKNVAAVFLRRGQLGTLAQRRAGQGREFEKLREYLPGDSSDEIHWKASAKRGHPVTKVFQIERTQEVYVIVDASRLSARMVSAWGQSLTLAPGKAGAARDAPSAQDSKTAPSETVLERFVTAALILGAAAEQQGDQFGLITFSDRVQSFVRAKCGQAHFDACRDRLYTLQPERVSPDFEELCSFIRLRLRKRALLIFLTALDDPMLAESFAKSVELICRQHLVLVNMLQPPGANALFSTAEVPDLDGLYDQLAGHLRWRDLSELEKSLHRRGVRLSMLDAQKLAAQLVAQHAEVKARQLV